MNAGEIFGLIAIGCFSIAAAKAKDAGDRGRCAVMLIAALILFVLSAVAQ